MTMNEMDDDTKHQYDRYANEVQQLEWEQAEGLRRARLEWVEDSLRSALADYDHMMLSDQPQVQHTVPEHTGANASQVVADDTMTRGKGDVNAYDADAEWDQEWDDLMSREELERAQREQEEGRDDH